jgi:hypothetical protein
VQHCATGIGLQTGGQSLPMAEAANLVRVRSMLVILHAICEQTVETLEAVETDLHSQLTQDLRKVIDRTESELASLRETLESGA